MHNRLYWYPIFYKDKLYSYLMSDNYYFTSNLYKMMENHAQIICMKRVKNFDEIKDYDREVIKQEDRIFGEEDIKKMFDYFERNNFKENPICEYVFGQMIDNQKEVILKYIFYMNEMNIKNILCLSL